MNVDCNAMFVFASRYYLPIIIPEKQFHVSVPRLICMIRSRRLVCVLLANIVRNDSVLICTACVSVLCLWVSEIFPDCLKCTDILQRNCIFLHYCLINFTLKKNK